MSVHTGVWVSERRRGSASKGCGVSTRCQSDCSGGVGSNGMCVETVGKNTNTGLRGLRLQLACIKRRQGKLVRDAPPAKGGTLVVQPVGAVDLVEAVERALGPALRADPASRPPSGSRRS